MEVFNFYMCSFQFAVLLAIIFILEIAAGALAYAYRGKVSKAIIMPANSVQVPGVRILALECQDVPKWE